MLSKFVSLAAFTALPNAYSDVLQLGKELQTFMMERTDMPGARSYSAMLNNAMQQIQAYGCWCQFSDNTYIKGKGTPVDAIDRLCKGLSDNYECAAIDGQEENDECNPWDTYYSPPFGSFLAKEHDGVVTECNAMNGEGSCAARACISETVFINRLFHTILRGGKIISAHKHSSDFDPHGDCPVVKPTNAPPAGGSNNGGSGNGSDNGNGNDGESQSDSDSSSGSILTFSNDDDEEPIEVTIAPIISIEMDACCGQYPDRFPYRSQGGDRQCCGVKTYNAMTLTCCDAEASITKANC